MPFRLETFAALRSRRDAVHAALAARHPRIQQLEDQPARPPAQQLTYRQPGTPVAPAAGNALEEDFEARLTALLAMVGIEFVVISLIVVACLYF